MRKLKGTFVRSFLLLVLFVVAMGIFVGLSGCAGPDSDDIAAKKKRCKAYSCNPFKPAPKRGCPQLGSVICACPESGQINCAAFDTI